MSDDLSRDLERLAERGMPRGADAVWRAATTDATSSARPASSPDGSRVGGARTFAPLLATAAIVAVFVASVALVAPGGDDGGGDGTDGPGDTPALIASTRLVPFEDCADLLDNLRRETRTRVNEFGLAVGGLAFGGAVRGTPLAASGGAVDESSTGGPVTGSASAGSAGAGASADQSANTAGGAAPAATVPGLAPPPAPQEAKSGASGADGFSTTNVQEEGVDEPDIVKTDGRRLFIVRAGTLLRLAVDDAAVTSRLPLENARDMLIAGDRLVVFSDRYDAPSPPGVPVPMPLPQPIAGRTGPGGAGGSVAMSPAYGWGGSPRTRITTVDISGDGMRVVSTADVDAAYVSSRLAGGRARVVLQSSAGIAADLVAVARPDASAEARAATVEQNRRIVDEAPIERWLPTVSTGSGEPAPLVDCAQVHRPPTFAGLGLVSVVSFDPDSPDDRAATAVLGSGQTVYSSADRVYVAAPKVPDQPVAVDAADAADAVRNPPATVVEQWQERTLVHAFDVSGDSVNYRASGEVRGSLLNQFSMSEYDGRLRIATTDRFAGMSTTTAPQPGRPLDFGRIGESFVSVFEDRGEVLEVIGSVGGLGRGEQIYAVRFIGELGYVVTFRQTDPLYVVDLRDPTAPAVRGELKVSGYSAYLHPVGDGRLLGIGQDATEEGRRLGTQVSLFDVSDPAAPRLVTRRALGYGASAVEYDHRAFLWWAAEDLAVLPVVSYGRDAASSFVGSVAMTVAGDTLEERGRVDASVGGQAIRSIVIGDRLFTLTESRLIVNDLDTLDEITSVPL